METDTVETATAVMSCLDPYTDTVDMGTAVSVLEAFAASAMERQKAVDDADPSDAAITLVLSCIGYGDASWLPFVRNEIDRRRNSR